MPTSQHWIVAAVHMVSAASWKQEADPTNYGFEPDEWYQMQSDFIQRKHLLQAAEATKGPVSFLQRPRKSLYPEFRKRRALHLHIHNSAGSYLCFQAHMYGENTTNLHSGSNCNMPWTTPTPAPEPSQYDGPFTPINDNKGVTCSRRLAEMEASGLTFAMIERWMNFERGDWCPEDLIHTVIIRDPVKRAKTTFRLMTSTEKHADILLNYLKGNVDLVKSTRLIWFGSHVVFSNLVVRSLNGPEVMKLPLGALTEEHLSIAMSRLRQFDAVLVVPTLLVDMAQLALTLGWSVDFAAAERSHQSHTIEKAVEITPELEALLEEHNQLDRKLYNFAVELARNRTATALAHNRS